MDPHVTEWLNIAIRWVHMITGVAWIGASFYFVWLENHLERQNPREGLSGDLWAIHGGGIYHLEKYKLDPPEMPENLHWFKWEAYATWLTGIALLSVVYYLNPSNLISQNSDFVANYGNGAAVALGVASLVAAWLVYDFLCDSALGKKPALMGAVLAIALIAAVYALGQVFTGRGAYIHVGAMIGTIMVGNVFRVIMPAQRDLVAAIEEGRQPNPALPAKGLLRSRHNNYLTLPVLFIMISNHFPSTYGYTVDGVWYGWAVFAALAVLAVLVRHYFNTRHETNAFAWTIPAAIVGLFALAYITTPEPVKVDEAAAKEPQVAYSEVQEIFNNRCVACHNTAVNYKGVQLHDPELMTPALAKRVHQQAVELKAMPFGGNSTGMLDEERATLDLWFKQGAKVN